MLRGLHFASWLIILSLGLLTEPVTPQRCPARWYDRPGGDSCYRFWPNNLKSWDEAGNTCKARKGYLLKLDSKDEKEWVIEQVKKYPVSYEWWIGLKRDSTDTDSWVWTDGVTRNESAKFIPWGSGEPNNFRDSEDCAEIWDNLLNDKNCRYPLQFICERPKDLPLKCDIDDGWEDLTETSCYKFYSDKKTLQDAETTCERNDASVLSVKSESKQGSLTYFLQGINKTAAWLNIGTSDTDDNVWSWHDSTRTPAINKWWANGPPKAEETVANNTRCAVMDTSLPDRVNWTPVRCDTNQAFVCEKPTGTCPPGLFQHLATCILIHAQEQLTWNEARGFCNLRGTTLLEIKNSADVLFLHKIIKSRLPQGSSTFWLGYSGDESNLAWDTGDVISSSMNVSRDGDLNVNASGCGYMQTDSSTSWLGDCGRVRSVICTVAVDTPVLTPSTRKPRYECPEKFSQVGNMCYMQDFGDPLDWYQARKKCQLQGADLPVVTSLAAQEFLAGSMKNEVWIGLNDRKEEGKFVWLDSSFEVNATHWKVVAGQEQATEPNNLQIGRHTENCVVMLNQPGNAYHSKWTDTFCTFRRHFFCQIRAELNIALGKLASQSSGDANGAEKAVDGCLARLHSSDCCTHTGYDYQPWWQLDLGTQYPIGKVMIQRRFEPISSCNGCRRRMRNFRLFISNSTNAPSDGVSPVFQETRDIPPARIILNINTTVGRYIRIDIPRRNEYLSLCEVQVFLASETHDRVLTESNSACYMDPGKWNGILTHSVSGRTCQKWVLDTPHKHRFHNDATFPEGSQILAGNNCRDPEGEGELWCYTTDPQVRWEYCAVTHCHTELTAGDDTVWSDNKDAAGCGPAWIEAASGACYLTLPERLTWTDALDVCKDNQAELVAYSSEMKMSFKQELSNLGTRYVSDPDSQNVTMWVDQYQSVQRNTTKKQVQPSCQALNIIVNNKAAEMLGESESDCAQRNQYACSKKGRYVTFHTGKMKLYIPLLRARDGVSIEGSTFLQFEFKGAMSAIVLLQRSQTDNSTDVIEIEIGGNMNTKSYIRTTGTQPKYTSFLGKLCNVAEYRSFWISWQNETIKVGKGAEVNRNVFMSWQHTAFHDIHYASISTDGGHDGYWRFKQREEEDTSAPSKGRNLALGKPARQSSTYDDKTTADHAVDGCPTTTYLSECCTHTLKTSRESWWEVDLGDTYYIQEVVIMRRTDCDGCRPRMKGFRLFISMLSDTTGSSDLVYTDANEIPPDVIAIPTPEKQGRYVKIDIPGQPEFLSLCEVQVFEDPDPPKCGVGWFHDPQTDTCFKFVQALSSWEKARDVCKGQSHESDLAVIQSPEQHFFLYRQAVNRLTPAAGTRPQDRHIWLGVHQVTADGTYQTVQGNPLQYMDWSFAGSSGSSNIDCAAISMIQDGHLGSMVALSCDSKASYLLCERATEKSTTTTTTSTTTSSTTITSTTTTRSTTTTTTTAVMSPTTITGAAPLTTLTSNATNVCQDGWVYNPTNGACYLFAMDSGVDFHRAAWQCLRHDHSRLASIENPQEQTFLKNYLMQHGSLGLTGHWDCIWVAGIDILEEGRWKWYLYSEPWSDQIKWSEGQPDNHNNNEDCGSIRVNAAFYAQLNDIPCDWTGIKGYVCKAVPATLECADGWYHDMRTNMCYKFGEPLSWPAALDSCRNDYQADLASITSQDDMDFLKAIAPYESNTHVWVGANDIQEEDMWQWSDQSTWWTGLTWAPGQPDNWRTGEHCGTIRRDYLDLNDVDCTHIYPFICKKPAFDTASKATSTSSTSMLSYTTTTPSTTTPVTAAPSALCGMGWELGPDKDFCYKYSVELRSWQQAREVCAGEGGDLLSIHSPVEQYYVSGRLRGIPRLPTGMWIGANDRLTEGGWAWSDGSPFAYFNWKTDELSQYSDADNSEDCVTMETAVSDTFAVWNAISCDIGWGYICKKKVLTKEMNTNTSSSTKEPTEINIHQDTEGTIPNFLTHDLYELGVRLTDHVVFKVRTKHDAHVLLQRDRKEFQENVTRVIIAGWGNTKSVIDYQGEGMSWNYEHRLLSSYEYRTFWISWTNRHLRVGRGDQVGSDQLLSWEPLPFDVRYLAVGTSQYTDADWKFETAATDTVEESTTATYVYKDPTLIEIYQNKTSSPNFQSHDLYELGVRPADSLVFEVRTAHDAHVLLQQDRTDFQNNVVLVIIGGWGNGRSGIWCYGAERSRSDERELLNIFEFRQFWVSWSDNEVKVGKGNHVGSDVIMSWNGVPFPIAYVSVATSQSTDADWRIQAGDKYYGCSGDDWLGYRDRCFLLVQKEMDWKEASKYCGLEGAELASIANQDEQNFLFSQLPIDSYCFNIWKNDSECNDWAERGECDRNPSWMATHCHHACKLCMHNCRDRFASSAKCTEWAAIGECDMNPSWMLPNCAQSCGVCEGAPTRGFWIGMSSTDGGHMYTWKDDAEVTYTRWDVHEPAGGGETDGACVAVSLQSGLWNSGPCSSTLPGFICAQPKLILPKTTPSPFGIGCLQHNSHGYGPYCYTYVTSQMSWTEAENHCHIIGGSLARIADRYVQAFVASEIINTLQDYWIGLSVYNKTLTWTTAQSVGFTHFAKGFIASRASDGCFALTSYKPVGLWKSYDCTTKLPFVCQSARDGFTSPAQTTTMASTTPLPDCEDGWQEYNRNCYKKFMESLTWQAASQHCVQQGATLLSIHSMSENNYIRDRFPISTGAYWIGYRLDIMTGIISWEDGSSEPFDNWNDGEPNYSSDIEECAEMLPNGRWNDIYCAMVLPYICKIAQAPNRSTIAYDRPNNRIKEMSIHIEWKLDGYCAMIRPYICKIAQACSDADPDWVFMNDSCYFVGKGKNFHAAQRECISYGGELASIHSRYQQDYLASLVKVSSDNNVFIGLQDLDTDYTFKWTDQSPVDYIAWNTGEPNDVNGNEKCVAIFLNGLWHDVNCNTVQSFLCQKSNSSSTSITTTLSPTTTPMIGGGCPDEFTGLGNKCYLVRSDSSYERDWHGAKSECASMNSELVTIHSRLEQELINTLLKHAEGSQWIGLIDLDNDGQFNWHDKSRVDFTFWNEGEPSSVSSYASEPCVELFPEDYRLGRWNDVRCQALRGYICSTRKQSIYPTLPVPVSDGCPANYSKYEDNCYRYVPESRDWASSQAVCQEDDANLARMEDNYEKAYIHALAMSLDQEIWLGGFFDSSGSLVWISESKMSTSSLETILNSGATFLYLKSTSVFPTQSTQQFSSICKKAYVDPTATTSTIQTTKMVGQPGCHDDRWSYYGGSCYYISIRDELPFLAAQYKCEEMGANLASIHSLEENDAIRRIVLTKMYEANPDYWIGMITHTMHPGGRLDWIDRTPVDFQHFYDSYTSNWRGCLVISGYAGLWANKPCTEPKDYICKAAADATITTGLPTTTAETTTISSSVSPRNASTTKVTSATGTVPSVDVQHAPLVNKEGKDGDDDGLSGGQVAGIVIGVLACVLLLGLIAYVVYKHQTKQATYIIDKAPLGFDNALFQRNNDSVTLD